MAKQLLTKRFRYRSFTYAFTPTASFYERYQLVDTWMLLNRSKEEIVLVKKEMKEYLKFLFAIRTELKQDFDKYLDGNPPFPTEENPLLNVCYLQSHFEAFNQFYFLILVLTRESVKPWKGCCCC